VFRQMPYPRLRARRSKTPRPTLVTIVLQSHRSAPTCTRMLTLLPVLLVHVCLLPSIVNDEPLGGGAPCTQALDPRLDAQCGHTGVEGILQPAMSSMHASGGKWGTRSQSCVQPSMLSRPFDAWVRAVKCPQHSDLSIRLLPWFLGRKSSAFP
jgi:hypothetical protein